jgi:hypothetical protein
MQKVDKFPIVHYALSASHLVQGIKFNPCLYVLHLVSAQLLKFRLSKSFEVYVQGLGPQKEDHVG